MTDSEYIRMRQAEGRGEAPTSGGAPTQRPPMRLAALMRLALAGRGGRDSGRRGRA